MLAKEEDEVKRLIDEVKWLVAKVAILTEDKNRIQDKYSEFEKNRAWMMSRLEGLEKRQDTYEDAKCCQHSGTDDDQENSKDAVLHIPGDNPS